MFDTSLRMRADGPRGLPVVNNLRFLTRSAFYAMRAMAPYHAQPIVPVTSGNASIVVALGEPSVRQVCTDNVTFHRAGEGVFNIPEGRPYSGMFQAVITANGDEHRRRRRLLMPVVHKTAMEHYQKVFAETFLRSRFADSGTRGEPFDMVAEFLWISKVNMLRCLLGITDPERHLDVAGDILRVSDGVNHPLVILLPWERPWTPYGRWVGTVADAYAHLARLIERRRGEPPGPDALSIVCHATDEDGDRLTTEEVAGELHGFFAAGFETTAMTMTWALLTMLASEAAGELDLADPVVLDAVVKESQRVLPAVPLGLPRRVTAGVTVNGSDPVPRGSLLFTAAVVAHHDPVVFPDPYAFRPSRWLDGASPSPYEYFPFGVGARRCLGAAFAEAQTRTTLALIARRTLPRLLTTKIDYHMKSGVTAAPRSAIHIDPSPGPRPRLTGSVTALWHQ
ncbi:cytochrome P450 [Sphaerisporangium aureirubrum]|uniref:Cytochrome P450 n=1 Tax=Sphaerisporangium aureirubrum TaxID=1544736 RepID=A0ABW1NPU0_9ACTN